MLLQLQRLHHVRVQPVQQMGEAGDAEARKEFFRARRAAGLAGGLQHQHLAAAPGQHCCGGEAVVAAADDDHIPFGQII